MKLVSRSRFCTAMLVVTCMISAGCAYFPETRFRQSLHNPFPQLKRIAVLPFFNQSNEATVDGDQVAECYYAALQAIPGFEVLPVGVSRAQWLRFASLHGEPQTGRDFQRLAREMGVEAIVVGSVTDFDPYYPPRMAMTVHWYAANDGFHPIPAGYGLPWGTDAEKEIPRRITREAEFELARSQMATQAPIGVEAVSAVNSERASPASFDAASPLSTATASHVDDPILVEIDASFSEASPSFSEASPLPADWPDPTDLIPDPPSPVRPLAMPNHEPVLTHTRLYRGNDAYFTGRLADYVETGDDARPGGWQDYLKRSDDFIRFCCHLHIAEMLESRGGQEQSDLILRWPLSRY